MFENFKMKLQVAIRGQIRLSLDTPEKIENEIAIFLEKYANTPVKSYNALLKLCWWTARRDMNCILNALDRVPISDLNLSQRLAHFITPNNESLTYELLCCMMSLHHNRSSLLKNTPVTSINLSNNNLTLAGFPFPLSFNSNLMKIMLFGTSFFTYKNKVAGNKLTAFGFAALTLFLIRLSQKVYQPETAISVLERMKISQINLSGNKIPSDRMRELRNCAYRKFKITEDLTLVKKKDNHHLPITTSFKNANILPVPESRIQRVYVKSAFNRQM